MLVIVTLSEIIGLVITAAFVLAIIVFFISERTKQFKCKHKKLYRRGDADVICTNCSKNFHFMRPNEMREHMEKFNHE